MRASVARFTPARPQSNVYQTNPLFRPTQTRQTTYAHLQRTRKPGTDTKFPAHFAGNWLSVPGFAPGIRGPHYPPPCQPLNSLPPPASSLAREPSVRSLPPPRPSVVAPSSSPEPRPTAPPPSARPSSPPAFPPSHSPWAARLDWAASAPRPATTISSSPSAAAAFSTPPKPSPPFSPIPATQWTSSKSSASAIRSPPPPPRSEERRVGKECR